MTADSTENVRIPAPKSAKSANAEAGATSKQRMVDGLFLHGKVTITYKNGFVLKGEDLIYVLKTRSIITTNGVSLTSEILPTSPSDASKNSANLGTIAPDTSGPSTSCTCKLSQSYVSDGQLYVAYSSYNGGDAFAVPGNVFIQYTSAGVYTYTVSSSGTIVVTPPGGTIPVSGGDDDGGGGGCAVHGSSSHSGTAKPNIYDCGDDDDDDARGPSTSSSSGQSK
jgi:hypothetical protein